LLIPADNAKSGKERKVKLTKAGAHFFDVLTAGKAPDDLIFTRANGAPWLAGSQQKPMKRACAATGIAPLAIGLSPEAAAWLDNEAEATHKPRWHIVEQLILYSTPLYKSTRSSVIGG
jgi:hypothetical protein